MKNYLHKACSKRSNIIKTVTHKIFILYPFCGALYDLSLGSWALSSVLWCLCWRWVGVFQQVWAFGVLCWEEYDVCVDAFLPPPFFLTFFCWETSQMWAQCIGNHLCVVNIIPCPCPELIFVQFQVCGFYSWHCWAVCGRGCPVPTPVPSLIVSCLCSCSLHPVSPFLKISDFIIGLCLC